MKQTNIRPASNRTTHNTLLAIPLAIITVLCFGFVLAQPHLNPEGKASYNDRRSDNDVKSLDTPAEAPLKTLEELPVNGDTGSAAAQPSYNPQPASSPATSPNTNRAAPYATSSTPVEKPGLLDKVLPSLSR